jgi:hypothetical protein
MPIPTEDLRSNVGTWAVGTALLPAIARFMLESLPTEEYDPNFKGQKLSTTYFDTKDFDLRKARRRGERYVVLRLRAYPGATIALSAKTEAEKFRVEVTTATVDTLENILPANIMARIIEIVGDKPLVPVVAIECTRYAVEDDEDRLTLDCGTCTDAGKELPYAVLEYKSNKNKDANQALLDLGLRPIKMSKFLWSTTQW